jgi:DNA-directed RNA polymerase specialized sigma24 family protein
MTTADEVFFMPENYRDLRAMLVNYLGRSGSKNAEELADETVMRVLEKRKAGRKIRNIRAYTLGVAHHVYLESTREPRTVTLSDDVLSHAVSSHAETLDDCLTLCMSRLPPSERMIVTVYHSGSGKQLVKDRRKLARKLGLSMDALRIRAHRIRKDLEACIGECLECDPRA